MPQIPEWDDPAWIRWRFDALGVLGAHPQELLDNMADVAHFPPVHGSSEAFEYFENECDGHILRMRYAAGHRTLVGSGGVLESDVWYTGPGLLMSRQQGVHSAIQLIAHTPVEDGSIRVWHALLVRGRGTTADDHDRAAADELARANLAAFQQDFEIWSSKRPALGILQIPADGPFHKVRQWYRQFFVPRERGARIAESVQGVHAVKSPGG